MTDPALAKTRKEQPMTAYSTLGARMRKLEAASGHGGSQKIYPGRIIARDEADKDRQISDLLAAGKIKADTMVICRMIVSPGKVARPNDKPS